MSAPVSLPAQRCSRFLVQYAGVLAGLPGGIALIGWWLNNAALKSIIPGSSPLKPNIAGGLLLCGVAVALLSRKKTGKWLRRLIAPIALIVIALGAATLAENFLDWDLGIDDRLVRKLPGPGGTSHPGRMLPTTAFCFILMGTALLMASGFLVCRLCFPLATGLSAALVVIGVLGLAGFAFEILFGRRWNLLGMSLSGITAVVGFMILGAGLLALLHRKGELTWSLNTVTTAGFAVGVLLMIGATAIGFNYTKRMLETTTWLTHRQEVLKKVQEVMTDVADLQSHQRLYVILGDDKSLEGREEIRSQLNQGLLDLRNLTADNPGQRGRLDQVVPLIAQRFEWEERVIAARRIEGFSGASDMIGTRQGYRLSKELHRLLREMAGEEYRLLALDKKQAESASTTAFSLLPMGVFLSLAILSLGLSFLNTGVTEQKRAERDLRGSEERYRTLFESNPNPMWVYDEEVLFILAVNAAAVRHYGYSKEEFLAMTLRDIRPAEDVPALMRNISQTSEDLNETTEWRHRKKDGTIIDVEIISHQLVWLGRRARLVLINDITARKRAEKEIQQLNAELENRVVRRTAELESANKELEAFSYSVSHDLRSPLRTVDGFSQAVLEDYGTQLPDEGRRYLQTIRDGAQRMGVLIDDLLTFSRLSRLPLHKQSVDMERMVREVFDELQPATSGRRIEIQIAKLPKGRGDPALLKQVWVNLLSNAIKYTRQREPAVIEIGCRDENGAGAYFVSDNGTGFDMQYAHKLFGVFQRLHRTDEFEGTGVGLAIVQRVVHRHGGRIWVNATPDRGATFYFTLQSENET